MDVTLPDGTVIRGVPDGITKAELTAKLRANGMAVPGDKPKAQPRANLTDGMSFGQKLAAGAGKAVADTGRGIGQLLGLVSQADVDEAAARDADLMSTGGGVVGNVLGQVAQMAVPGAVAGRVSPAFKALTAARPIASAAAGSGAYSALQPVLSDDTRAGNAAQGALLGGLGQAAATGAGAVAKGMAAKLSPEVSALYQKAQAAGIPVNLAQLSDSKFVKTLSSAVEKMPFTGGVQSRNAQQAAFNRAVSKTFGENTDTVTRDVYASAKGRIGQEFERLSGQNAVAVDNALLGSLGGIVDEANRFATDDTARAVRSAVDEFLGKADAAGNVPGKAYQALDSKLGKLTKAGGEKAMYLGQVRETVRGAMDASIAPADRAAWQQARGQYKNLMTVRDLVAKEGADGNISAAQLMGRVNASQAGKNAMAAGRGGEMGDLAVIGRQFVRDPIPDSGTAQRLMAMGALGGGGAMLGVDPQGMLGLALAGATGGRMANRILNSPALVNGSAPLNALSLALRPAPYLLPATVNAFQQ